MQSLLKAIGAVRRLGALLEPYLMIEVILPGGTLVALLLYLSRRYRGRAWRAAATMPARRIGRVSSRPTSEMPTAASCA